MRSARNLKWQQAIKMLVTSEQREAFERDGYFVTDKLFTDELLDSTADDFERLRNIMDAERAEDGGDSINIVGRNFIWDMHDKSSAARQLAVGETMSQLAMELIGDDVRLYWDQAVTKAPRTGGKFDWHQDSGYYPIVPEEYLTIWLPLHDVNEHNGTLAVMPGSHRWGLQEHKKAEDSPDLVGYDGDNPGVTIDVAKGHAIAMSSMCLHRSGPNQSDQARLAYVIQFCPSFAIDPNTGGPRGAWIEVARGGEVVCDQLPEGELGELGVGNSTKQQVTGINARKSGKKPRPLGGRV